MEGAVAKHGTLSAVKHLAALANRFLAALGMTQFDVLRFTQ